MSGPYSQDFFGIQTGGMQPASVGYHPVYTPVPSGPLPIPADRAGAHDFLCEALKDAFCRGDCSVLTDQMPHIHPGFRTRVERVFGRRIIIGPAATANQAAAATSIAQANAPLTTDTTPSTVANFLIPQGKVGVMRGYFVNVMHGDPRQITWTVGVAGGDTYVDNQELTDVSDCGGTFRDLRAFGFASAGKRFVIIARTAQNVSPYLLEAGFDVWTWPVQRTGFDSVNGTVNGAGRQSACS